MASSIGQRAPPNRTVPSGGPKGGEVILVPVTRQSPMDPDGWQTATAQAPCSGLGLADVDTDSVRRERRPYFVRQTSKQDRALQHGER